MTDLAVIEAHYSKALDAVDRYVIEQVLAKRCTFTRPQGRPLFS